MVQGRACRWIVDLSYSTGKGLKMDCGLELWYREGFVDGLWTCELGYRKGLVNG